MAYRSPILPVVVAMSLAAGLLVSGCAKNDGAQTAKAHEEAAAALISKSDFNGAIQEYTLAIEANPKSDLDYEGRGNAYTELKNYDSAIADFSKAIELAPSRGGPYFGRGVAYRLQGNLDSAITDLSHAIGDMSKTRWRAALYERGLAYSVKGNIVAAQADFQKILDLEAERPGEADKSWAEKAQAELTLLVK
jgi:tetratricopeptide (TPR) repeat protein